MQKAKDEPGLRTMVLRVLDSTEMLQQQMTKQEELIRSMKEEAIVMCMYYAIVYNTIDNVRESESSWYLLLRSVEYETCHQHTQGSSIVGGRWNFLERGTTYQRNYKLI